MLRIRDRGFAVLGIASRTASKQRPVFSVIDSLHASTLQLNQSTTATRSNSLAFSPEVWLLPRLG